MTVSVRHEWTIRNVKGENDINYGLTNKNVRTASLVLVISQKTNILRIDSDHTVIILTHISKVKTDGGVSHSVNRLEPLSSNRTSQKNRFPTIDTCTIDTWHVALYDLYRWLPMTGVYLKGREN